MKNSAVWPNAARSDGGEFIGGARLRGDGTTHQRYQLDQTNGLQGFWYPPVAP